MIPCPECWLTHGRSFSRFLERYPAILMALNSIYTEKEDFAALGHMLSMLDHEFQLSCLALHDVFSVLAPLTLWLQTSPSKMDITVLILSSLRQS